MTLDSTGAAALPNGARPAVPFLAPVPVGEAEYGALFAATDQGACIVELLFDGDRAVDYRFLATNPAFERQTGLVDAVGRTARALVPDLEDEWVARYGAVAATGEERRFELGSDAMGRSFAVHAFRIGRPAASRTGSKRTSNQVSHAPEPSRS